MDYEKEETFIKSVLIASLVSAVPQVLYAFKMFFSSEGGSEGDGWTLMIFGVITAVGFGSGLFALIWGWRSAKKLQKPVGYYYWTLAGYLAIFTLIWLLVEYS